MAVQVELWRRAIEKAFFSTNDFLQYASDVTSEVINGAIVHIPNSPGPSGAERNRTVIPATAVMRADTDVVYALDHFTSNPRAVTKMEQDQISYQKMQSAIEEDGANMLELSGSAIMEYWMRNVPAANRISSTGADKNIAGLTGTRKRVVAKQLRDAALMFDNMKIPMAGRTAILTAEQFADLYEDNDVKNTYTFQNVDYANRKLPKYAGWDIINRAYVSKIDSGGTAKLPEAALAGTDDFCGLFIHKSCVEFALGERTVFYKGNDPEYYGDVMSMLLRAGGRAKRADNKGVALLIQAK